MNKFVALILLCMLLAGSCSAAGLPWQSGKAKKCVKSRKCWTKPQTAVCGVSPSGRKIGFPNRCYFACVNFNDGDSWGIDGWYTASDKCYKKWSKKCSRC